MWVKKFATMQEAKDSGLEITRYNWQYYYFGEEGDGITDEELHVNGSFDQPQLVGFGEMDPGENRKFGEYIVHEFMSGTGDLSDAQANGMLDVFGRVILWLQLGALDRALSGLNAIDFTALGLQEETKMYFTTKISLFIQERS